MNKVGCAFNLVMILMMSFLSAWILKEYLRTFLDKKRNKFGNKIRWIMFILWQVFSMLDVMEWTNYIVLSISVCAVLLVAYNYSGDLLKKIVFAVVYNSIWLLLEVITVYIFIALGLNYAALDMLGSLFSKILLLILVMALKRFFGDENIKELPHSYSMILILIPLGSMFVVYTSFFMSAESGKILDIVWSFASLLILFLINIMVFTIYLKLSEDLELRQKNIVYEQEIYLYNKHIEEKENSMLEIRKAKHDLKNQLIFLLERCEKKEYEELEQFLQELIEKVPLDNLTLAKTDNSIVDALVNYKYSIAKRFDIDFSVKLDIPVHLPFDNADMCIILGNVLDNALEANMSGNIDKKYVKLNMRMDTNNLFIIVENSFDGKIKTDTKGHVITLKTNKVEEHGLGLGSIQKAVDKYSGIMKVSYTDMIFTTEILLYSQ